MKELFWKWIAALVAAAQLAAPSTKGIFSWQIGRVQDEEVLTYAKEHEVGEIYQLFDEKKLTKKEIKLFLQQAAKQDTKIYSLCGEKEWALPGYEDALLDQLELAKKINGYVDQVGLSGVAFDVEPYSLPAWETDSSVIMESFVKNMRQVYEKRGDLEIYICIPFYYDNLGFEAQLEQLIADCCDGVMVMNYSVGHEISNIETEAALCQKYEKRLINIYEMTSWEMDGLEPYNTYWDHGVEAADENFAALYEAYGYEKLSMAYHDFESVRALEDF